MRSESPASAAGYTSVMVHLDLSSSAELRVRVAANIADRFNARLIGVAGEAMQVPLPTGSPYRVDRRVLAEERVRVLDDLSRAETTFRVVTGNRTRTEWRTSEGDASAFLVQQARAADIVVVGQRGRKDVVDGRLGVSPGDIAMRSGRPVLFVPPSVTSLKAEHVIVGWKDTREARRAIWDSLPFLKLAEKVLVASIGPGADDQGAEDVADHLCRHGLSCNTIIRADPEATVADQILKIAERVGADLLVTGAYAHSRVRQWILGGVTRDLLEGSPICCLMSH
jgi:nucleotide-binding universal stress UspA family protein